MFFDNYVPKYMDESFTKNTSIKLIRGEIYERLTGIYLCFKD